MTGPRAGTPSPRWAFLQGFGVSRNGRPYLDRLRIVQTPWFSLLLHRIHGPDPDRDPHDHPWWFASLILSGGYVERIWADAANGEFTEYSRPRFSVHPMPLRSAHMITGVSGVLWTLVLTGPRQESWRFWTTDGAVDWREYAKAGESTDDNPW